ncbi:hypothetical protein IIA79_00445, partial [bacterium]|nr:hypothetical protein [bacterium]
MRRFVLTAALGFILGLGSCQGSRVEDMGGAEAAGPSRLPFSQDLRQALFELDALPSPAGVDGGVFEKLKEALSVMLIEGAGRTASAGGVSCLTDMQVQEVNEDGTDYLEWRYTLFGDYDLNGEVNIADITPIAQNFTETFPFADPRVAWVDGDRNGEINVSDLTPLGQHFGVSVLTYSVFRSAQGADPPGWTETGTLDVRDLADDVLGGLGFRYELEADHGDFTYKVLPRSGTWHRNEIGAPDVIPPVMGAVSGLVTDTDGQPLAGVDITLTLPGSSEEYTAQSDEAGLYIVGRIDLSAIYAPRVDVQLRYSLDGYAEGFESATVWGGRCAVREIQLLERTIEGKVPSKAGGSVGTKSALQLTLPPAGLVRADGTPMLIAADVALTYGMDVTFGWTDAPEAANAL